MPDEPSVTPQLRTHRMEALSDGVMAIAITLLVLEIAVPAGSDDRLLDAIRDQWPSYLAFVVSFSTIGAVWIAHNTITEYLHRTDAIFLRANLLLLMVVSFIPFPTQLVAEYIHHDDAERVAVTFYGINLLAASLLISFLWQHALRENMIRPDLEDREVQVLTYRLVPGLGAYVAMIVLGVFFPTAAVVGYLLVAIFFLVPFGIGRRSLLRRHS